MKMHKNFKLGLVVVMASIAIKAFAADTYVQANDCAGKEMTGKEVVETLIKNPKAKIIKFSLVELSEKTGKIKNKSNR